MADACYAPVLIDPHLQLETARYAPVLISLHGLLWVIGGCALGTSPGHKQSSARATSGTSMFEQAPSVECFDNTTRQHYILPQFSTLTAVVCKTKKDTDQACRLCCETSGNGAVLEYEGSERYGAPGICYRCAIRSFGHR